MFGVVTGEFSVSSVLGGLVFLLLGGGMFAGIFNMSRSWEENREH
jgi:F0F1-type ATP synthase assembly protein I